MTDSARSSTVDSAVTPSRRNDSHDEVMRPTGEQTTPNADPRAWLHIVGGFRLMVGSAAVSVPLAVQRLLAFLALHGRPVTRSYIAGNLWPDTNQQRAAANLRAALWRTPAPGLDLVQCTTTQLGLDPAVAVDHRVALDRARELVATGSAAANESASTQSVDIDNIEDLDEALLSADLLPGWEDDWVVVERERLRQLRLHALESICLRFLQRGATAKAIDVGLRAVAAEPLRESAQRALVQAHLCEGNVTEALHTYNSYASRLFEAFGVSVSPLMVDLIAPYLKQSSQVYDLAGRRAIGAARS
jgi:DNA-binding SARP family transcriptional activator